VSVDKSYKLKKLTAIDLPVGRPLEWPIYTANDQLILPPGYVIQSERVRDALLNRGAHRHIVAGPKRDTEAQLSIYDWPPLLEDRIVSLYRDIATGEGQQVAERTLAIAEEIQRAVHEDLSAFLVSCSLGLERRDGNPLFSSTMAELIGLALNVKTEERRILLAAALTRDVGMYDLLHVLDGSDAPLTASQRSAVEAHPQRGVAMLENVGVTHPAWLAGVAQHHERRDGSGYPAKLKDRQIGLAGRILAVADQYTALARPRSARLSETDPTHFSTVFTQRCERIDPRLPQLLLDRLGPLPPGQFVKFDNGEIGIYVRPPRGELSAELYSLMNARGQPKAEPRRGRMEEIVGLVPREQCTIVWDKVTALFRKT